MRSSITPYHRLFSIIEYAFLFSSFSSCRHQGADHRSNCQKRHPTKRILVVPASRLVHSQATESGSAGPIVSCHFSSRIPKWCVLRQVDSRFALSNSRSVMFSWQWPTLVQSYDRTFLSMCDMFSINCG